MDEWKYPGQWQTVRAEVGDGIGWAILNRPVKRNAMNPTLNRQMQELLRAIESDDALSLVVHRRGDSLPEVRPAAEGISRHLSCGRQSRNANCATAGDLAIQYPQIREADINPIVVYPAGEGTVALDALLCVQ